MLIQRTHTYKIYDPQGNYLGVLNNVVSPFQYNQLIGTAFTQITVLVEQSTDNIALMPSTLLDESNNPLLDENGNNLIEERQPDVVGINSNSVQIANDNSIIVTEYSQYNPNGVIVFSGYISKWKTTFGADNNIELTCISNGQDLSNYPVMSGDTAVITQATDTSAYIDTTTKAVIQTFNLAASTKLNAIGLEMTTTLASTQITIGIYQMVGATPAPNSDPVMAYGSITVGPMTKTVTKINFNQPVTFPAGNYYFLTYYGGSVFYAYNTNPYASGQMYTVNALALNWDTPVSYATSDVYFIIYQFGGSMTGVYTSVDTSTMLTGILQNYQSQGGQCLLPPLMKPLIQQPLSDGEPIGGSPLLAAAAAQIVTPVGNTTFNSVQLMMYNFLASSNVTVALYKGDPSLDSLVVTNGVGSYSAAASNILIATSNLYTNASIYESVNTFTFNQPYTLLAGVQYYFVALVSNSYLYGANQLVEPYPLGYPSIGKVYWAQRASNGTSALATGSTLSGLYIGLYYNSPATVAPQGGYQLTGTVTSYAFKIQTILQAIQAIDTLSPANWYWYVNPGTNILYWLPASTSADITLIKGKHLNELDIEATRENIKNNVYFTGGDDGTGTTTNIFVNVNAALGNNRAGLALISDNRINAANMGIAKAALVTISQAIAKSYMNQYASETYITNVTIIDTTIDIGLFNLGMMVGFAGFGTNVERLLLQIVGINRTPDSVTLQLGTLPIRSSRKVSELEAALIAAQTLANPLTAS